MCISVTLGYRNNNKKTNIQNSLSSFWGVSQERQLLFVLISVFRLDL